MNKIELQLVALTNSETYEGQFAVILENAEMKKRIPVTIGQTEARAIAMAVENVKPPRPQTHDLFHQSMLALGVALKEVVIHEIVADRYHALVTWSKAGENFSVDARTSDAIALAIRFDCPIYTYDTLLDQAGYGITAKANPSENEGFINFPVNELEDMMEKALKAEDYENASRIRDAINKKKGDAD